MPRSQPLHEATQKTVLITGAAGFLGSHLANQLAREGHMVRGLDDFSTGDPQVLDPDVHFTRGDVNDRPKLWTLLQDVDCVYHLAARISVPMPRPWNSLVSQLADETARLMAKSVAMTSCMPTGRPSTTTPRPSCQRCGLHLPRTAQQ